MVHAVDERHVDVGLPEPPRGGQAAEAAADDHDPAPALAVPSAGTGGLVGASPAPSRSSRWSPTRSALAIAVSAGFTAPMLGKKLVSTT